jgi:gamma-glutamylcyclotransferase (GGCT)/AIG2-like uncharacterized protein YtfP
MYIIVYGTLKKGENNNRILETGKARLVGPCEVRGYKLYWSGFPVAAPSAEDVITGEVWDISGDHSAMTLNRLDSLEGVDHSERDDGMYQRREVTAYTDNGTIPCQMYVGNPRFWRNFNSMRECPSEDRKYTWSR